MILNLCPLHYIKVKQVLMTRPEKPARILNRRGFVASGLSCSLYSFPRSTLTKKNLYPTRRQRPDSTSSPAFVNVWRTSEPLCSATTSSFTAVAARPTDCSVTRREMDEDTLYPDERGRANGLIWLRDKAGWLRHRRLRGP